MLIADRPWSSSAQVTGLEVHLSLQACGTILTLSPHDSCLRLSTSPQTGMHVP